MIGAVKRKRMELCLFAAGLATLSSTLCFAQANNGAGEGKPVVHVDFYRLPPGRQDEWLALYRKVHLQVMQWEKEQGQVISETIYTHAAHQATFMSFSNETPITTTWESGDSGHGQDRPARS